MNLAELSSPEIAPLAPHTPVVVPIAAMEQHGLHLPLATDSMLLGEVLSRVEPRLQAQVLFCPLQWLGEVAVWIVSMRTTDLRPRDDAEASGSSAAGITLSVERSVWGVWWEACLGNRRFWTLVPFVVCINAAWHLLRAWLPKFLQEGRGASEAESLYFNSAYYVSADVGCIAAGAVSLWLVNRGRSVHVARLSVIAVCAVGTALACVATSLPRGPGMYAALLVVGAGAMGLFPCYYSLAQEVSPGNVGRATGMLAMIGWLLAAPLQQAFGRVIDQTRSFDIGLAWAGFAPLVAFAILLMAWPREQQPSTST